MHISVYVNFKQRCGTKTLKCLSSRILKVKGEKRDFFFRDFFISLSVCYGKPVLSPDVLKKALPFVADNKLYTRLKGNFENQF